MALGARPLGERDVAAICERKMADFRHKANTLALRHLPLDPFLDVASDDPDVRFAVESGYMAPDELRDPVLLRTDDRELYTCPPLVMRLLSDEPAEIHRAFVEGAFLRKLFRLFVPATFEGGEAWEVTQQVREVMQRHFAFQLIACESVLGEAA